MAAIPYNSGIDLLNVGEVQNAKFQMLASAPNALEAKFYYDTTLKSFGYYNGTKWVYLPELTSARIISALGYTPVSNTTTVNGKALSSNITLTATDVGALPDDTVLPTVNNATITIQKNGTTVETFTLNQNSDETINIVVPTQASDVGALPDTTTINDLTSTAQQNALNSGINSTLVGKISTNESAISTINGKIPSAASTTNQLADKAYVDDSIQTNSAHFRGNWATWTAVPTNVNDYPADDSGNKTPTVNDYMVVRDASDYTGETLEGSWQFVYTGTWATNGKSGWEPKFQLNESPFTQAQLDAINSGANTTNIGQIATNTTNISSLQTAIATKADAFAVTNPTLTVSGGVCTWSITNSIGTKNVQVSYYRESDGVEVKIYTKVTTSTITASLNATGNITAGTYRAVVIGLK